MKYALAGSLRGLGVLLLTTTLSYFGTVDHLTFLTPQVSGVVAMLALAVEHYIEGNTGKAFFGSVSIK